MERGTKSLRRDATIERSNIHRERDRRTIVGSLNFARVSLAASPDIPVRRMCSV